MERLAIVAGLKDSPRLADEPFSLEQDAEAVSGTLVAKRGTA
jgi:hypothetical protein